MLSINANRSEVFSRALTGGYKGYDEIGEEAYLLYYLSGTGTVLASVADNTTNPASNGKYITIRGVDFAGTISGFPRFPNGNSTIIDYLVPPVNKGISVASTTANRLNQKFLQNYLFPKKFQIDTLDFMEYNIPIVFGSTVNSTQFTNIDVSVSLKKVNQAGTISTIGTVTHTVANKTPVNTTVTENLNGKFSSITGIDDQDLLYLELSVESDIQPVNTSVVASMYVAHVQNSSSYFIVSK